jgi:glycerol-3-phosphate cytidylyltransferase-like family protein
VFFETAAKYGDLYVCIGSDENVRLLKGRAPKFSQDERLYMVQSVKFVKHARIATGSGLLDFEPDIDDIRPDIFIVNEDGASEDKRKLCEAKGVEYLVLPREPKEGLPARSSTAVKASLQPPYRLCLAGGWLDQPFVSKFHSGPVIVVNIHPTREFNLRSGMATSTRQHWLKLWPHKVLGDDHLELAKLLFGYENPPGTQYVAGSQDAIGLTHPGVSRLFYEGGYWPLLIDSCVDPEICDWLENSIREVELFERPHGYDPLVKQNLSIAGVRKLALAGEDCWNAIQARDIRKFGQSLTDTHRAWAEILPLTTNAKIDESLKALGGYGSIATGCGGGYAIVATDKEIQKSFRVRVRR